MKERRTNRVLIVVLAVMLTLIAAMPVCAAAKKDALRLVAPLM